VPASFYNSIFNRSESTTLEITCNYRVGHLTLRALAIRASDPQNALTRTSFHSPKSLPPPPPPPCLSNHFSDLLFLRLITGNFLFDYFTDSRNIFPHFLFCTRSVYGEHAMIRKLGKYGKQFACNVVKYVAVADQGLFLQ